MPTADPFSDFIGERKQQIENTLSYLEELKSTKIILPRPVFFVPGWNDDNAECWTKAKGKNLSLQQWIQKIATNPPEAYFVNFVNESPRCRDFSDFGECLKKKIRSLLRDSSLSFDVVTHGMGGLELRVVLTGSDLFKIHNCITVGTPHRGYLFNRGNRFLKLSDDHKIQLDSLKPDGKAMSDINTLEHRRLFLERVDRLYQFKGTQRVSVNNGSVLNDSGIENLYKQKAREILLGGSEQIEDKGIAQDPRTILAIIKILGDIDLPKPDFNYGYIHKRN